jgi:hypothetical protein
MLTRLTNGFLRWLSARACVAIARQSQYVDIDGVLSGHSAEFPGNITHNLGRTKKQNAATDNHNGPLNQKEPIQMTIVNV